MKEIRDTTNSVSGSIQQISTAVEDVSTDLEEASSRVEEVAEIADKNAMESESPAAVARTNSFSRNFV